MKDSAELNNEWALASEIIGLKNRIRKTKISFLFINSFFRDFEIIYCKKNFQLEIDKSFKFRLPKIACVDYSQ